MKNTNHSLYRVILEERKKSQNLTNYVELKI